MEQTTQHSAFFQGTFNKPVTCTFDVEAASSDGGGLLLGALDRMLGLIKRLAAKLQDKRDPGRVEHTYLEILRQRVFSIALGYPDCNDASRLANDPVLKMLCDRDAVKGPSLASQPTLSRFENSPSARELIEMGRALEDFVIQRHRKRLGPYVRLVTIDLDPSDDPTHGQQTFSFFNGHYGGWCYLPIFGFISFNNEPEQYLFYARLRPGNSRAPRNAIPTLRRIVKKIRESFPYARIRVRLDGGFASPLVFQILEELDLEYIVAIGSNKRLRDLSESWIQEAREKSIESGKAEQIFGEFSYATMSWPHQRRIILKAEVVHLPGHPSRDNIRFVVTNLNHKPENIYKIYRKRGEIENRIKELHYGLGIDRTSCPRFLANQLRVIETATAYILFQELRLRAKRTEVRRAQVRTLREKLLKIGVRVVESVRRVVLHFPITHPWQGLWIKIARKVGAIAT